MFDNRPTLTIALPDGQQWTCALTPEVVAQLIAAAEQVTDALRAAGSPKERCITPAECAARELEMALWERLFRTVVQQATAPASPYPSAVPTTPTHIEPKHIDLYTRLPKVYRRMRKEQRLAACDIGLRWQNAVQERYDAGDVAGADTEVRELIAWLEETMASEPDDRFVVMAYAHALTLLGQMEEHRFTTTGVISASLHAAVLYQAAQCMCDDACLAPNNTLRTVLRAAIARVTTEYLDRDALDDQLKMVLQPGWHPPKHLDGRWRAGLPRHRQRPGMTRWPLRADRLRSFASVSPGCQGRIRKHSLLSDPPSSSCSARVGEQQKTWRIRILIRREPAHDEPNTSDNMCVQ